MKTLDLNEAANEFEAINDEHPLFYNTDTGEFEFYIDPIYSGIEDDAERFEQDCWIAAPSRWDIREYDTILNHGINVSCCSFFKSSV